MICLVELPTGEPNTGCTEETTVQTTLVASLIHLLMNCRPSAIPKGAASTPVRSDGRVVQSLLSQREAVLEDLGIDDEMLEVSCNHKCRPNLFQIQNVKMISKPQCHALVFRSTEVNRNVERMDCMPFTQTLGKSNVNCSQTGGGFCRGIGFHRSKAD